MGFRKKFMTIYTAHKVSDTKCIHRANKEAFVKDCESLFLEARKSNRNDTDIQYYLCKESYPAKQVQSLMQQAYEKGLSEAKLKVDLVETDAQYI